MIMSQNNEEESNVVININIGKLNFVLAVICIILSYYKDHQYAKATYDCLFTILIYNNIVFLYVLYLNIKNNV